MRSSLVNFHPRQPRRCLQVILFILVVLVFSYVLFDNVHLENDSDGDFQILYGDAGLGRKTDLMKDQRCRGFDKGGLQSAIPQLGVGKARYDNKRMVKKLENQNNYKFLEFL